VPCCQWGNQIAHSALQLLMVQTCQPMLFYGMIRQVLLQRLLLCGQYACTDVAAAVSQSVADSRCIADAAAAAAAGNEGGCHDSCFKHLPQVATAATKVRWCVVQAAGHSTGLKHNTDAVSLACDTKLTLQYCLLFRQQHLGDTQLMQGATWCQQAVGLQGPPDETVTLAQEQPPLIWVMA